MALLVDTGPLELKAQEFLGGFEVLSADRTTALTYARLRSQAKQAGHTLPDPDYWIAALAIQHGLRLLTMDRHFDLLDDLRIVGDPAVGREGTSHSCRYRSAAKGSGRDGGAVRWGEERRGKGEGGGRLTVAGGR